VEEQWKGEPCIAEVIAQNSAVMVQPFAAEKKVVWHLLGSTATLGAVCFAYAEEVYFVVAMAKLELVEGTGNFLPSPHRNI
jgi:hypothetical protein